MTFRASSKMSGRRRQVIFFVVLVVLVLGVAGGGLYSIYHESSSTAGVARTVTVQRGIVQESVSASGNISPALSYDANFSTSGTVSSVDVAVGDQVKAGEVLATLDPSQAQVNLQSAEVSLQAAETTLAQDENGGTSAQLAQDAITLSQQHTQLTADEQTLTSDETTLVSDDTTLTDAENQLAADQALDCPSSSSSASSTSSSTGTSSSGSGSGSSSGSGAGTGASAAASDATTSTTTTSTTTTIASTPPTVSTGAATSVTPTTVDLNGTVNPDGAATLYYFEYGKSTASDASTSEQSAGSGTAQVSVSSSIGGLSPNTSYFFQLIAANSAGVTYGDAQYVTTAQSSCVVDQQSITTAQQNVTTAQQTAQRQQATDTQQQATIAATRLSNAVPPSTIAADESQVAQARLTVTTDEQSLAGTQLRAPISGTVTTVNGFVGSSVSASPSVPVSSSSSSASASGSSSGAGSSSSSGFITIDNFHDLEVVAGFPEADATNIALGQPATVTLSALPNTEVSGKVSAVSPTSTVVSNVVTYNETVLLENPPATVKDGMTALVSIVVATATGVLEAPSAAITTTGTISTVTVKQGKKTVIQRVTLGLVGNSTTEILTGVKLGDVLVEPTASVSSSSTGTSTVTSGRGFGGGGFGGGGFGG